MRLLILLLPWLELFTLVQLGIETSALTVLGYVALTFAVGAAILQRQGQGMIERLRETQEGRVLGPEMLVDDMAMGVAGILLMIPGLFTDVAALAVMIGPLRRRLARAFGAPQPEPYAPHRDANTHVVIEGSYRRVDDGANR